MKIALYKLVGIDLTVIRDVSLEPFMSSVVRVSEAMDVEFAPRIGSEAVAEEINLLDAEIAEKTQVFAEAIDKLKDAKAKLLAITHAPAPAGKSAERMQ
jgi:FMN phosphatase YigB (HAD superfamily)